MALSATTLNMKFMQRAALKRGEIPGSPSPSNSGAGTPSSPAGPSTPGRTTTGIVMGSFTPKDTAWTLPAFAVPNQGQGGITKGIGSTGSKGKEKALAENQSHSAIRISYAQSYMAFMDDDDDADESDDQTEIQNQKPKIEEDQDSAMDMDVDIGSEAGKTVTSSLSGSSKARNGSGLRGRIGYGEFAPKAKSSEAPALITTGLSNGMKPRPSSSSSASSNSKNNKSGRSSPLASSSSTSQPHPYLPKHLSSPSPGDRQASTSSRGVGASPLSRVIGQTISANNAREKYGNGKGNLNLNGNGQEKEKKSKKGKGKKRDEDKQQEEVEEDDGSGDDEEEEFVKDIPPPKLDSKGFAKPSGFEDLPVMTNTPKSTTSNKKKKNKRSAPVENDGNVNNDGNGNINNLATESSLPPGIGIGGGGDTDILTNGARASKKSKKNKKDKKKDKGQTLAVGESPGGSGGGSKRASGKGEDEAMDEEDSEVEQFMKEMMEEVRKA